MVSVQGPVRLDDFSEPEPDFALLKPRPDSYRDAHAQPSDVLLLIEVADTSLNYDRAVKRALYARHEHIGALDHRSERRRNRSLSSARRRLCGNHARGRTASSSQNC